MVEFRFFETSKTNETLKNRIVPVGTIDKAGGQGVGSQVEKKEFDGISPPVSSLHNPSHFAAYSSYFVVNFLPSMLELD